MPSDGFLSVSRRGYFRQFLPRKNNLKVKPWKITGNLTASGGIKVPAQLVK